MVKKIYPHEVESSMQWPLPAVDDTDRAFWSGGGDGALLIQRCTTCSRWQHPPAPLCRRCLTRTVVPTAVSGRGRLITWSTNLQPWTADMAVPYTVGLVGLVEQSDCRLVTRLVDVADPVVGLPLQVRFEQSGDVWLPLFGAVGC
jgi:uncharacterized OB-fold protein